MSARGPARSLWVWLLLVAAGGTTASCWLTASFAGLGDAGGGERTDARTAPHDGGDRESGRSDSGHGTGTGAGARDADAESGVGDAGPVNLLENPGFELGSEATGSCGAGWAPNLATLSYSPIAHSGNASCLVCPTSTAAHAEFFIDSTVTPPARPAGTTYVAYAYFRLASGDGGTNPPSGMTQLECQYPGGVTRYAANVGLPVTDEWQRIGLPPGPDMAQVVTDASTETVSFLIDFFYPNATDAGGTGGCVLVDDVALYAEPPP